MRAVLDLAEGEAGPAAAGDAWLTGADQCLRETHRHRSLADRPRAAELVRMGHVALECPLAQPAEQATLPDYFSQVSRLLCDIPLLSADVGARDRAVDPLERDLPRHFDLAANEAGVAERGDVLVHGDRPGDASRPLVERAFHVIGELAERDHVGHGEAPARSEDAVSLPQRGALVGGE